MKPGDNIITVTANDSAGNIASATVTIAFVDVTNPTVSITGTSAGPGNLTNADTLRLWGQASDNAGLNSIKWENDQGGTGYCSGGTSWSASNIPLKLGVNNIKITATDTSGLTATASVAITFSDNTAPTLALTKPVSCTSNAVELTRNCTTLNIEGTTSDNIEISSVLWSDNHGNSGVCTGVDQWSAALTTLELGENIVTITAKDTSNNYSVPLVLTVNCIEKADPGIAWQGLAMISVPLIPDETDPKQAIGFYGTCWNMYKPSQGVYTSYGSDPSHLTWFTQAFQTPGKGYWARFDGEGTVPDAIVPPQDQPATIHLSAGWNIVGQPFLSTIPWDPSKIMVKRDGWVAQTLQSARGIVGNYAWGWRQNQSNPLTGAYYLVYYKALRPGIYTTLEPWHAYWIYAYEDCDLILPAPSVE